MPKSGKSSGSSRTHESYRSAKTGRFVPEGRAKQMNPANVVKERVPNPGYGDTKPKK